MNISKALKCSICGKYIIDDDDIYAHNTCSVKCSKKAYQHNYWLFVRKNKRKENTNEWSRRNGIRLYKAS